jgi:hypothetical protein
MFETEGFTCEIHKYWSTQSTFFQNLGVKFGLTNTFVLVAVKRDPKASKAV